MNITVFSLVLNKFLHISPLFSLSYDSRPSLATFYQSRFSHFYNSVYYSSNSFKNVQIKECEFQNVLNSAIHIISTDKVITNQYITENLQVSYNNLVLTSCQFKSCKSNTGGALNTFNVNLILFCNIFSRNTAHICGAASLMGCQSVKWFGNIFYRNEAEYDGAFSIDAGIGNNSLKIESTNISYNEAKMWSGGFRIDSTGGKITDSLIVGNSARVTGGFFDFSWTPSHRDIELCLFQNNSAQSRGGAVCAFHLMHSSKFSKCAFIENRCKQRPDAISMESVDSKIVLDDVYFDGPKETQIGMRFGFSKYEITDKTKFVEKANNNKKICDQFKQVYKKSCKNQNCAIHD